MVSLCYRIAAKDNISRNSKGQKELKKKAPLAIIIKLVSEVKTNNNQAEKKRSYHFRSLVIKKTPLITLNVGQNGGNTKVWHTKRVNNGQIAPVRISQRNCFKH